MTKSRIFDLLLILVIASSFSLPLARAAWTFRDSLPPHVPSNAVCYGSSKWVAVGDHGKIIHSTNGTTWQVIQPLTDADLHEVIYAGGQFVAVGDDQTVLTSTNGLSWTHREPGIPIAIQGIAYGAGIYVMIGEVDSESILLTTDDFLTWSSTSSDDLGDSTNYTGLAVMFGNGKFVAPIADDRTLTSTDGYTWQSSSSDLNENYVQAGCFADGSFYIASGGQVKSSTDGLSWTSLASTGYNPGPVEDLLVRGNTIIFTMELEFFVSYNLGQTWQSKYYSSAGYSSGGCGGVNWGDGKYIIMFDDGSSLTSTTGFWPAGVTSPVKNHYLGVCYGNGNFVTVGHENDSSNSGIIRSSTNGITWSHRHTAADKLMSICYGNGTFVAVGESPFFSEPLILTSTNLTSWTKRSNPASYSLQKVIYAQSKFIAVGGQFENAVILTSNNGITWEEQDSNAPGPLVDITYGNGLFVAAGSSFYGNDFSLVTSPDGVTWTDVGSALTRSNEGISPNSFSFVSYGNGFFLAGKSHNYFYRSTDGITWTEHTNGDSYSFDEWKVHFSNGRFVAVGGSYPANSFRSVDGLSWTMEFPGARNFRAVTEGNGTWVGVGHHSRIVTAPDGPLPAGPANIASTGVSSTELALSWDPDPNAKGYYVYWRPAGQVSWRRTPGARSTSTNSFTIGGLEVGNDYEFAIQTIKSDNLSELAVISTGTPSLLELWRLEHFGSTEDSGPGGNTVDFDLDGRPNLVEYAVGGDPKGPDTTAVVTSSTNIETTALSTVITLEIKFWCDADKPGITCYVETSPDMSDWTRIAESIDGERTESLQSGVGITDHYYSPPRREVTVQKQFYKNEFSNTPGELFMRFGVEEN